MPRTIIHADLDAFYASVEQLDNPELKGQPVVVGGPPEARGVVMAASYEARKFSIRSAMPMVRALRLCPEAVRLPPRFDRYGEVSRQVMKIFRSVTPLVESISLDEAFLDVTEQVESFGGPRSLATNLKAEIEESVGIIVSVGIGTSKTVAKIASDQGKPDGLVIVSPGEEASFLAPLSVQALWGIGPKAEERLAKSRITTIGQLAHANQALVDRVLGTRGPELQAMAQGRDDRPVVTERELKSVGAETTFSRDLPDGPELRKALTDIARHVAERLRAKGLRASTLALKLRYADFKTISRQKTLSEPVDGEEQIAEVAAGLLERVVERDDRFRLLGIQGSRLTSETGSQRSLWDEIVSS